MFDRFRISILAALSIACMLLSAESRGQEEKYRAMADSLQNVYENSSVDSIKVRTASRLMGCYIQLNIDSALSFKEEFKQLTEAFNQPLDMGRMWHQISSIYYFMGEYDSVIWYGNKATEAYQIVTNLRGYASVNANVALAYREKGYLSDALRIFNQVLHISDTLNNAQLKHSTSLNMALIYGDLKQHAKATNLLKSIVLDPHIPQKTSLYALACNNLASNYLREGRIDESARLFHKALEISKEIGFDIQVPRSYINLATNLMRKNKLDSAELLLRTALDAIAPLNSRNLYINCYLQMGELYLLKNQFATSKSFLLKGLKLAQETNTHSMLPPLYELLAEVERHQKEYATAYRYTDSVNYWRDSLAALRLDNEIASSETRYKTATIQLDNVKKNREIESLRQQRKINNLLFALAGILAIASMIIYLLRAKQKQSERLSALEQTYAQSTVKQLEDIKRNWAEQLHDDVGQDLVLARQAFDQDNAQSKAKIDAAISKIRSISQQEYPHLLEFIGLKATIEKLIDEIEASSPLIISESIESVGAHLTSDQAIHLYRILQELLKNTIKHGSAASTSLKLQRQNDYIQVRYEDNGTPFDFKTNLRSGNSLGLKQISDRFNILGAKIIQLPDGQGNNLYIFQLPCSK